MNEALTGVIRAQLAVNFFWIFRSIANSTKDEWKLRLRKKYGMTFGDLYKKRKGLYRKLDDEDVELMRAREEKKVARRKAKDELAEKSSSSSSSSSSSKSSHKSHSSKSSMSSKSSKSSKSGQRVVSRDA